MLLCRRSTTRLSDLDYALDLRFHHLALNDVFSIYNSVSKRIDDLTTYKDVNLFLSSKNFIYHKYQKNNLMDYTNFLTSLDTNDLNGLKVDGYLGGYLKISSQDLGSNDINILLTDFNFDNQYTSRLIQLSSKKINPQKEDYEFFIDRLKINDKFVDTVNIDFTYDKNAKKVLVTSLSMDYLNRRFKDFYWENMTFKINGQILILDLRMIPLIFCPFFYTG